MNLQEFKSANPAYKDVPDLELADALHQKFYSEIPKSEFYSQVGVSVPDSGGGAGRGSVNPPAASEPQPVRDETGAAFGIYPSAMGSKRGLVQEQKKSSVLEGIQIPDREVSPEIRANTDSLVEQGRKRIAETQALINGENRTPRSGLDYLKDLGISAAKITPSVAKNLVDIGNLLTAGQTPLGDASKYLSEAMSRVEQKYGSKAANEERRAFSALMASDAGASDVARFIASNPLLAADMGITTAGSMAVPLGAVGAAGKVFGKLAPATATGVANATNALMNAGDTFSQVDGDAGQKMLAAGIAGAGSLAAGKLTGGGLEGQMARQSLGGNAGLAGAKAVLGEVGKEAAQEYGENASQSLGQDIGQYQTPDLAKANREGLVGAMIAPVLAGPVSARNAAVNARQDIPLDQALIHALETGQTVKPLPASAPVAPPTPAAAIDAIGAASSVDEAISAAQAAVSAPSGGVDIAARIAELEGAKSQAPLPAEVAAPPVPAQDVAPEVVDPAASVIPPAYDPRTQVLQNAVQPQAQEPALPAPESVPAPVVQAEASTYQPAIPQPGLPERIVQSAKQEAEKFADLMDPQMYPNQVLLRITNRIDAGMQLRNAAQAELNRRQSLESARQQRLDEQFAQARSGTTLEIPENRPPRPLSVDRAMEILQASKERALLPQERGYLDAIKDEIGDRNFDLVRRTVMQPFLVPMSARKFEVAPLIERNRQEIAQWDNPVQSQEVSDVQNQPARIGAQAKAQATQAPKAARSNAAVPVQGLSRTGAAPVAPVGLKKPKNPKLIPLSKRGKDVDLPDSLGGETPMFSRSAAPETPEFKRWFGDSKVVGDQGRPLVMYHGTSANEQGHAFTSFDTYASNYGLMGMGGYFTADPAVASSYTSKGKGTSPTVYPVYLSVQNPIDMDAPADVELWKKQFDGVEQFHEGGKTNESWYRAAEGLLADQSLPKWEGAEAMQDGLRTMGFDGITHIGGGRVRSDDVRHRVFIVFDPEQIKSAIGNSGQFDPSNPDIRFSRTDDAEDFLKTLRELRQAKLTAVRKAVNELTSEWANRPEIVVVGGMQDPAVPKRVREADEAQKSQGADGEPEGFFYGGKVYILASEVHTPEDIARVLFHESLGHYGLRGTFGDGLKPILKSIADLRPDLMKPKAKQYGLDLSDPDQRAYVAEEVLAELAQTKPELGIVKRAIAAIRTWLRENIKGFDSLKLTDDEIIRNYILPAQGWVERGEVAAMPDAVPSFAREEDARELIITHNLTAANLLHAKKMGGIAVPSLAVTKKSLPLSGFGEVTLIGDRNVADPKGYAKTKVFGADIYSPRYPSVERELDSRGQRALIKKFEPMAQSMGVELPDTTDLQREGEKSLGQNLAVMAQFLEDQGIKPEVVSKAPNLNEARIARLKEFGLGEYLGKTDAFDLVHNQDFVQNVAQEAADAYRSMGDERMDKRADRLLADPVAMENIAWDLAYKITADAKNKANPQVDRYATQTSLLKQIEGAGLEPKLQAYVRDQLEGITKSERIPQGFTPSGNKKYVPHTLENVVKILKKELRGGESFNYGVGSLRSKFTPEFKSIADIKKAKGRLVSAEDFEPIKEQVNREFLDLANNLDVRDETLQAIIEDAVSKGVERSAKSYNVDLTEAQAKQIAEFMGKLSNLPTAYFEAKVLRPMDVSEFSGAVVPHDLDADAAQYLADSGIRNIEKYTRNNEEERKQAINRLAERMDELSGGNTFFSRSGGWNAPADTRTDKLIYNLQDGRIDLKRVQEEIAKTGVKLDEQFDARLAETLYAGRVAKRSSDFLKIEVKPLLESMAKNGISMDELSDFLLARHAPERNEQIAKVNPSMPDGGAGSNSKGELMTTQAAKDYLAAMKPTRRELLTMMAKRVDALTAGTRDLLVREGLEKAETVNAWAGAYKHYVPLFKDEAEAGTPHPQGSGFSVKGSASKRAMGSKKQVTNMLAHVLMQREAALTRAEKNRVGMSLYGLVLSQPNSDFWTAIRPSMSDAEIESSLEAMGVDPAAISGMERAPTIMTINKSTGQVQSTPNPMYKNRPNAIVLKVNGEDRVILFNEGNERAMRLAENLKNLDGITSLDLAGSVIGKATRFMASMATQYNPAFGMVNLVRDTGGALVNLTSTPLAGKQAAVLSNVPAAINGIARDLRGGGRTEWSDLYQQFQDDGGQTGYKEMWRTADERAKAIEADLKSLEKAGKLTIGKVAHAVLSLMDGFNTTLENAVRLSAYKEALDHGLSRPAAAKLARELTVDFNRKGRLAREINPLYAFFNASLQGTARHIEALKGPAGKKILIGGLTLGVLQYFMLATAGYDDEDVPEFVKARALIIPMWPFAAKKYIAIPLPLGLHVLPNTGRVLTELMMSKGKDWGKKSFNALGEIGGAFNPLGGGNVFTTHGLLTTVSPTVVDPLIDLATNRNFAGNKISKETFDGDHRPGYQLGKETTARLATGKLYEGIAQAVNRLSGGNDNKRGLASPTPEVIRYLAGTLGGGLYREVEKALNVADAIAHNEPVRADQVPLGSRFYGEVDKVQVNRTKFFENMDRVRDVKAQLKSAEKARDMAGFQAILKDNPTEVALIKSLDRVTQDLSELNKIAMESVGDRERLKKLDEARDRLMASANESIKRMEEIQAAGKAR